MDAALWSLWWLWVAAALVLAILEVLLPGYIFLGFALGAFGVGMILLNTDMTMTLSVSLLVFAGLSLITWLLLRRIFAAPKGQVTTFDHDVND